MIISALEGKRIDLDLTPEEAMHTTHIQNNEDYDRLQKEIAAKADIAFPFVDVWDFKSALAFMVYDGNGNVSEVVRLTEEERGAVGISEEMIRDAVYENGSLSMSGNYPINDEIREKLAEAME